MILRRLAWLFGATLATLALLLLALALPGAPGALATLVERASAGRVRIDDARGSLYSELYVGRIEVRTLTSRIAIEAVHLKWRPSALLGAHLEVTELAARRVTQEKLAEGEPATLPASLELPLRVSVHELRVAEIEIVHGPAFQDLRLTATSGGANHEVTLRRLVTPWGRLTGAGKIAPRAPFTLATRLALNPLPDSALHFNAHAEAAGTLADLGVRLDAASDAARLTARARLAPFGASVMTEARVGMQDFDPSVFIANAPRALLQGELLLSRNEAGWQGEVKLDNRAPGRIDQNRVPLVLLAGRVTAGDTRVANIHDLVIDHGEAGRWQGEGRLDTRLVLNLSTRRLDLHGLHGQVHPTRLAGGIELDATQAEQTLRIALSGMPGPGLPQDMNFFVDLAHSANALTVSKLELRAGEARVQAEGKINLDAGHAFTARGRLLGLDPSRLGRWPAARINGNFDIAGRAQPLAARLRLDVRDSRWRGQPLSGGGKFALSGTRIHDTDLAIRLGDARLALQGAFGARGDRLTWQAKAPDLAVLHDDWRGALDARGWLSGMPTAPSGRIEAEARALRFSSELRLNRLHADIELGAGERGALRVDARLSELHYDALRVDSASLDATGARHAHQLRLQGHGTHAKQPWDLRAAASGGWHGRAWRGTLEQFASAAPLPIALRQPAPLRAASDAFDLDQAAFDLLGGALRIDALRWSPGHFASRGRASGLNLAQLPRQGSLAPVQDWHQGLAVAASWDAELADAARGEVKLWREKGDLRSGEIALGLQRFEAQLRAHDGRLHAQLDAAGTTLGKIEARAAAPLSLRDGRWGVSGDAPLAGQVAFDMASLAWLAARLDASGALRLGGSLRGALELSGTIGAPEAGGEFSAREIELAMPEHGLALRGGRFDARLEPGLLRVSSLEWHGASGLLRGAGEVMLRAPFDGHLDIELDALELLTRPDRRLVVGGALKLGLDGDVPYVRGKLRAERALVLLSRIAGVTRSADVVVVRPGDKENVGEKRAAPRAVSIDLELDAGPDFVLNGHGLDARLTGAIRLSAQPGQTPRASGRIATARGKYSAYGQKLDIERGVLDFAGPIDNPGLDILAKRRFPEDDIEVGVAVGGTLLLPSVRLVSKPDMADEQKLAWLVLGHSLEEGDQGGFDALSLAASTLLSSTDSVSLQAQVAQATGLDEIGMRSADTFEASSITLGKRLSERVYLSFEQSLDGLSQLARLKYQLSRRLSVEALSGTENAVDLFYTFSFD
jgi:translocation and assembly module TamB